MVYLDMKAMNSFLRKDSFITCIAQDDNYGHIITLFMVLCLLYIIQNEQLHWIYSFHLCYFFLFIQAQNNTSANNKLRIRICITSLYLKFNSCHRYLCN